MKYKNPSTGTFEDITTTTIIKESSIATTEKPGIVKPDNSSLDIAEDGTLSVNFPAQPTFRLEGTTLYITMEE